MGGCSRLALRCAGLRSPAAALACRPPVLAKKVSSSLGDSWFPSAFDFEVVAIEVLTDGTALLFVVMFRTQHWLRPRRACQARSSSHAAIFAAAAASLAAPHPRIKRRQGKGAGGAKHHSHHMTASVLLCVQSVYVVRRVSEDIAVAPGVV
jgi:hypothetical protein